MAESLLQQMFPHALYVKSAGVRKGELDPFAVAVMAELGQDISGHKPMTFEELDDWEGLNFDLIITLAPEAHHKALELTRTLAADVEYWPTHDPTGAEGNREQKLQAYREVCDGLLLRIRKRFSKVGGGEWLDTRCGSAVPCRLEMRACLIAVVSAECLPIGSARIRPASFPVLPPIKPAC